MGISVVISGSLSKLFAILLSSSCEWEWQANRFMCFPQMCHYSLLLVPFFSCFNQFLIINIAQSFFWSGHMARKHSWCYFYYIPMLFLGPLGIFYPHLFRNSPVSWIFLLSPPNHVYGFVCLPVCHQHWSQHIRVWECDMKSLPLNYAQPYSLFYHQLILYV